MRLYKYIYTQYMTKIYVEIFMEKASYQYSEPKDTVIGTYKQCSSTSQKTLRFAKTCLFSSV